MAPPVQGPDRADLGFGMAVADAMPDPDAGQAGRAHLPICL